eukprot:CAMPEP_0170604122 /NCGR_PEP_ID=MMETSP0224-20130122/19259_1 /TAXON_ID=285029 /ORGANISM="Togula jolla, Strain CCCM 725" /LENGTH=237 /DNA_ID=CAMNT_0010929013 /DNA_START=71 /DNA_END=784 /DNA_ORIENTATION=+
MKALLIVTLAVQSAGSDSWVDRGEANAAVAKKFLERYTSLSSTNLEEYAPLLADKVTWVVNPNGIPDSSFSMIGAWRQVITANAEAYSWMAFSPASLKAGSFGSDHLVAINKDSNGKTILGTSTFRIEASSGKGAAQDGVEGTETVFKVFVQLDFNDDHRIQAVTLELDSGIAHYLRRRSISVSQEALADKPELISDKAWTWCMNGAAACFFTLFGLACGLVYKKNIGAVKQPMLLG